MLELHTGCSVEDIIQQLGTPSDRMAGYPDTYGDAQRQLKEMGIETLIYAKRGITIYTKQGIVFGITVVSPFSGTYHDARLGTHFSEIQKVRGNPDQTYFGPGAKRETYKDGETWKWGVGESAGYYISNEPKHIVVYELDWHTGKITKISETDDRVRGEFFIVPVFK